MHVIGIITTTHYSLILLDDIDCYNLLDAIGLRVYITINSKYHLFTKTMNSDEYYFILPNQLLDDIPKDVKNICFHTNDNYKLFDTSLCSTNIPFFNQLHSIICGDNCFKNVCKFVLDGLEYLKSVIINRGCFTSKREECYDGLFQITNCPNFQHLAIGDGSFGDFKSFKLSNLNSLQSIKFGNNCFKNVREFVLDDLESLKSVKTGISCFRIDRGEERNDGICRIMNCPNLTQLEIGYCSFEDFKSFELSNLNSLQSIKFGLYCFVYADFSLKGE